VTNTATAPPLLPLVLDRPSFELRRALEQEGIPHCERKPGEASGQFVLGRGNMSNAAPLAPGQSWIDLDLLETDDCDAPEALLADQNTHRKRWSIGMLPVEEEVAAIDKRAVRRRWMHALRQEIELRGGVWLNLASCPFPYRSAFNLRIDHDDYHAEDFHALLHALRGQDRCVSHYVCAAEFARRPEALARLRGWHVGAHGFHHHAYPDFEQNLRNITRGWLLLERAGLKPDGYVAPHGRFSKSLHDVLAELHISHSSEFGLAYDDAPFEPYPHGVLQVPVHPVCLGVILEAATQSGIEAAAVIEPAIRYFEQCIAERYQAGEPVLLYDHPTGRWGKYPQVVRAILASARDCSMLWRVTLSEIARWSRARSRIDLRVFRDGDEFVVFADRLPPDFRVAVEYWRGEHVAPMPLAGQVLRFSPSSLAYQRRGPRRESVPVRVDRPESLRGRVKRMIDWEKVTPTQDIDATTVRGWVKKTLRSWRN
jgi:hypothetical protein